MTDRPLRALVTGGSTGLGAAIARGLAERGYHVTIVSRDPQKLDDVLEQIPGTDHRRVTLDLSVPAGAEVLCHLLREERFDLLVNNAGAARFGALTALDADTVRRHLQLNLVTPALASRTFLAGAPPGACLVNVTSIVGTLPLPGNAVYSAARAGLQALTACLSYEARKEVRVLDFRPVGLQTDFHRSAGGESMGVRMAAEPTDAARDLINAIERRRTFVYTYGPLAKVLECAKRLLPGRWLIRIMGRKARRAGYL